MAEDTEDIYWVFRPPSVERLKRCVQDAFADVVYPGDDNITISACPCQECRDTRELFQGKHWREMAESGQPLQFVGWGGLAIMSPHAWHFYLPAYLIRSLSGEADAEDALTSALYNLMPNAERASVFSVVQQACISAYACAVLESLAQDEVVGDEAVTAAATYWKGRVAETEAGLEVV